MYNLRTSTFNMGNTESKLSLSLNQVIPIEKMYPVGENIGTEFTLVGGSKIVGSVSVEDCDAWGNKLGTHTVRTTEVFVDPVNASNLNAGEYFISTEGVVKAKGALPGRVTFSYKTDNSISVSSNTDTETTLRLAYAEGSLIEYEGIAAVGSSESSPVWMIKKYFYDGASNITSILYADGNSNKDNIWTDRETLVYS